jgi:DNA 3'-phosphatase
MYLLYEMEDNVFGEWYYLDGILFYIPQLKYFYKGYDDTICTIDNEVKLAGFDMDSTLIKSNIGERHAKTATDWMLTYKNVGKKLKEYHTKGYQVCIISNRRAGLTTKTVKETQKRTLNFFKHIGFECFTFLLLTGGSEEIRKPNTLVFTLFLRLLSVKTFAIESFFCGDAAKGFSEEKEYQWSDVDYKLSVNWNKTNDNTLIFYTPCMIFG